MDPHFQMMPVDGAYPSGWVLVGTRVCRQGSDLTLKLYYDRGTGLNEGDSVVVPVSMKGRVLELVQLPPNIRALRWDPMQGPGRLEQASIRISEVGVIERAVRMLLRVIFMLRKQDKTTREMKGLNWPGILLDLKGAYLAAGELRNFRGSANATASYERWIARNDSLKEEDRVRIRAHAAALAHRPLISVLMPTYNTPAAYLREAIDSVRAQLYDNWELCIADDASTQPHVKEVLEEHRSRDSRIRVCYREANGHSGWSTVPGR